MNLFTPYSVCFFILFFFSQVRDSFSQGGFPYCEPLNDGIVPTNTILGGDARLVSSSSGNGVLQLTSNANDQRGYLYLDIAFPSTYGIKASFEYFSYGGEGNADGLAFFLFDASIANFQPGGFGGALGYAPNSNQGSMGISGAYLGIGLDEFGNFSNPIEGKDGIGFFPNSVVIRGPGNGNSGYNYVASRQTDQVGNGFSIEDIFPISSGGMNTSRVDDPNKAGYRRVFINLQPSENGQGFILDVEMQVATEDNKPRMVTIFENLEYTHEAPENLKIGFAASTGGSTNYHEIRNIIVEVSDEPNLAFPQVKPIKEEACRGGTTDFEITEDNVTLPNLNSRISCLQIYKTLEEIIDDEELDPCLIEKCNPEHQRLELEEGVFITDAEGGKISFTTASDIEVGEVVIYYTVTDNYGKTSKPDSFTVKIFDFPEAPVIFDANDFDEEERVPANSFKFCEGDGVRLKAFSGSEGNYQWFKNGMEIEGEVADVLDIYSEGIYSVWMINEANCTTMSQEVEITYPLLPEVVIEGLVVSCGEELVDLRLYIEGYDADLFHYEITAPDGSLYLNDDLHAIDQSGTYSIRVKYQDLDCWSDFFYTEILIVENPVEADFQFGVIMENGGEEMIDIFINDPIQFTDLSLQDPKEWEWDFGDGNKSLEQNPQHAYSQEGNFMVALTVYDEESHCFSTKNIVVNVSRSYRIMYPTAFTPLGNENRFFKPKTKGIVKMSLYIFNSWGDLIYVSDDITDEGWDGTRAGNPQPNGNYVFKVEFITVIGERVTDSGKFTLIR